MTEIRNVAADLARFKRRVIVIGLVVLTPVGVPAIPPAVAASAPSGSKKGDKGEKLDAKATRKEVKPR